MSKLLSRLWNDEKGAIISVELILIIGILIFGLIPGLAALRNSIVSSMVAIGNTLVNATSEVGVAGLGTTAVGGTTATLIGYSGGFQTDNGNVVQIDTIGTQPTVNTINQGTSATTAGAFLFPPTP